MRFALKWCTFVVLGLYLVPPACGGDANNPKYLNKLLKKGRYGEFSQLTGVPEDFVRPVYVDFKKNIELNSIGFGDIMLSPGQYYYTDGNPKQHCNGVLLGKWDRFVPYAVLPHNYTKDQISVIEEAIRTWNSRFRGIIEYRPKTPDDKDFVIFFRGNGCYTHLGKVGGRQAISIKPDLESQPCLTSGWLHHEMMHTIGMMHTNNRPDRDLYLRLVPENVPPDFHHFIFDFVPDPNMTYTRDQLFTEILGPYEYESLMHNQGISYYGSPSVFYPRRSDIDVNELGMTGKHELTALDEQMVRNFYNR